VKSDDSIWFTDPMYGNPWKIGGSPLVITTSFCCESGVASEAGSRLDHSISDGWGENAASDR
jgi:hypothetical protein